MEIKPANLKYNILPSTSNTEKPELLFLLHGIGSNKEDLFSFANQLPKHYTIISIQAPISYFGGWAWYNLYPSPNGFTSNNNEAKEALNEILKFIDNAVESLNANPKVTPVGFSQGAILSLATALNYPNRINKVVAMSGYLNVDFLSNVSSEINFPILATHGEHDEVITLDKALGTYEFFQKGKFNFKFKRYPMPHGVSPECLSDVISFLHK